MSQQAKRPNHRASGTRPIIVIGLALLAIATLLLAAAAMLQGRDTEPSEPRYTPTATAPSEDAPAEPEAEPTPEPPAPVEFVSPAMQRLLAVGTDGEHVLRAMVGQCPSPEGWLEVSFDAGLSWESGRAEVVEATALLQLDLSDPAVTRFVSLDTECAPQAARSFVGGTSWQAADLVEAPWRLDPASSSTVHTPLGERALPCDAVALSSSGGRAVALCANSSVTMSEDSGDTWAAPVAAPSAVSVGVTTDAFVVASGGEPDCAGVRTRTLAGSELSAPGACVGGADGRDGQIAVTGGPAAWFLWAGDAFLASSDGGATWF